MTGSRAMNFHIKRDTTAVTECVQNGPRICGLEELDGIAGRVLEEDLCAADSG